jgi:acyl dehydratase
VLAGDTVHTVTTLDSLREREGKMGGMVIADYITQYVNQHGETVATQRNTVIRMGVSV